MCPISRLLSVAKVSFLKAQKGCELSQRAANYHRRLPRLKVQVGKHPQLQCKNHSFLSLSSINYPQPVKQVLHFV